MDILSQQKLFFFEGMRLLLSEIDRILSAMLRLNPSVTCALLSAFSHSSCRGMINLNDTLKQGGFLQYDQSEAATPVGASSRKSAVEAIARGREVEPSAMRSLEGRLDLRTTVAASPVAGCVYLNRADRFADGIVSAETYGETCQKVRNFLHDTLSRRFGNVSIEDAPEDTSPLNMVPDFVINIPGVEFCNVEHRIAREQDHPRTTHSPKGFAILSTARDLSREGDPRQRHRGLMPDQRMR